MKQHLMTTQSVRNHRPCYDPTRWVSLTWSDLPSNLLKRQDIPVEDRLWVVAHVDFIERSTLLDFAIWCIDYVLGQSSSDESCDILRDTLAHFSTGETNTQVLSVTTGNMRHLGTKTKNNLLLYVVGIAQSALGETDLENVYRDTLTYIENIASVELRIELGNKMIEYLINTLESIE